MQWFRLSSHVKGVLARLNLIKLCVNILQSVEAKGVLKVTFVDYVNPGKFIFSGRCCDLICDNSCETYFKICLQPTYKPIARLDKCMKFVRTKERKGDNFDFLKAFGPAFGLNGEENPIVHHFDDSWQVIVAYLLYIISM